MARTQSRPADAGATSAFSPSREAMLHDVQADAQRTCSALASVMELLQGCDPAHQITTGHLLALLEPVWGGLETVCGDLATAGGSISFN